MKWDKGNTPIMARIVPGTTIRIRPPWQKEQQMRTSPHMAPTPPRPLRGTGFKLHLVETPKVPEGEDKS